MYEPQALNGLGVQALIQRQIRYLLGKEAVWELPCSPLSLPVYFPTSSAFFFFVHSSQTTSFFQLYQKHNLTPMCVVILY